MVILITGITSGFGRAMAKTLAAEGHHVWGTHRSASEMLPGVGYIRADVCSEEDCMAAVKKVMEAEGRIDVLISNAGMGVGGPIEFTPDPAAARQMDVNFLGTARMVRCVLPFMRAAGGGTIICVSSIGGRMGLPYQGFYSASKFAIEGYCEALRLETGALGIKVVVIEPGDFATGFTASRSEVDDPAAFEAYPGFAASMESIRKDETGGLSPEVLAARVSKILRKKHPRYRYVIASFPQRLSITAKALLPAPWFAKILSLYYKL